MQKDAYQAELFTNRIKKRTKHLLKWAKKNRIFAFRIYDRDIPEIPLAMDIYFEYTKDDKNKKPYIVLFLYKRPYEKSLEEEKNWISGIINAISTTLNISKEKIFFKMKERQKGSSQYKKLSSIQNKITVKEGNCLFLINFTDYLDTGLFLDHRPSRLKIFKDAKDKKVLNLYSYTGSFSIHSLAGGAKQVTSVDLSNTYLNWAKENVNLNKLNASKAEFIKNCSIKFLQESIHQNKKWDIIICDPPTFSNSKQADTFDINTDWKYLCLLCLKVLDKDGVLYFSSNSLKLKFKEKELFDEAKIQIAPFGVNIKNISIQSIPEDFRNKKIHRMWEIKFFK